MLYPWRYRATAYKLIKEDAVSESVTRIHARCSDCEWNSAVPTLLSDAEAKSAFDRLVLQEVRLEYRDNPKMLAQAQSDAEDFLRRVREGLI